MNKLIIQFEGTDGTGKTTIARAFSNFLWSKNYHNRYVHYPSDERKQKMLSGGYSSQEVKDLDFMEEILDIRNRKPEKILVEDRGLLSTAVYGSEVTRPAVIKLIEKVERNTVLVYCDHIYDETKNENILDTNKLKYRKIYRKLLYGHGLAYVYKRFIELTKPASTTSIVEKLYEEVKDLLGETHV